MDSSWMTLPRANREPLCKMTAWLSQMRCTPSRSVLSVISWTSEQRIAGVKSGASPRSSTFQRTSCRASFEVWVSRYDEIGEETMQAYWAF